MHFVNRGSKALLLVILHRSLCLAAYYNLLVLMSEWKAGSRRYKKNDGCQLMKRSDFEPQQNSVNHHAVSTHRKRHNSPGTLSMEGHYANRDSPTGHQIPTLSKALKTNGCQITNSTLPNHLFNEFL